MDLFDFQEETFDESYCPKRLIEFKRYRETMKGNSLNTIKSYTLDIIILLKYLYKNNYNNIFHYNKFIIIIFFIIYNFYNNILIITFFNNLISIISSF